MSLRTAIFWVHFGAGVVIGAVVLSMAVTGSILAFRYQIMDWAERDVRRVQPLTDVLRIDVNTLIENVKAAYPGAKPQMFVLREDPAAAFSVGLGQDQGRVYVNPYTGAVLGKEGPVTQFLDVIEHWHRWLAMEGKFKPLGHNIVGVCAAAFVVMILTGMYLWWPRQLSWPALVSNARIHPGLRGRAKEWNWHSAVGLWSAPFLLVIALTGVIMCYSWANALLFRAAGTPPPSVDKKMDRQPGGKKEETASIDAAMLFAKAQAQRPDWKTITLRVPKGDGPVMMTIESLGSTGMPRRSPLSLNAATGEVLKWEPFEEQSRGRQWRSWARFLHTGEAYGVFGQIIAFFAAGAAVLLVWTGFAMAWRRIPFQKG